MYENYIHWILEMEIFNPFYMWKGVLHVVASSWQSGRHVSQRFRWRMEYHFCFCVTYLKSIIILKTPYIDWIGELFTPIIHNINQVKNFKCTVHACHVTNQYWRTLLGLNNPHRHRIIIWPKNLQIASRIRIEEKAQTNTIRTFSGSSYRATDFKISLID